MNDQLTQRDAAIMELAKTLQFKLEHVDPQDVREWDDLDECEREMYAACVRSLLAEKELILTCF